MIDEKTPYGLSIAMIAGAQVSEMRCNKKGQIDLAIAKAQRLGVPIDVNDKEDFAAVLLQARVGPSRTMPAAGCWQPRAGHQALAMAPPTHGGYGGQERTPFRTSGGGSGGRKRGFGMLRRGVSGGVQDAKRGFTRGSGPFRTLQEVL
jgi:hypothetical protein